jgi:hypothetical protein
VLIPAAHILFDNGNIGFLVFAVLLLIGLVFFPIYLGSKLYQFLNYLVTKTKYAIITTLFMCFALAALSLYNGYSQGRLYDGVVAAIIIVIIGLGGCFKGMADIEKKIEENL